MRKHDDQQPLLLDARQLAGLLGISLRSVHRFRSSGRLPRAVQVCGSSKLLRWSRAEIEAWVAEGMPPLRTWEANKRLE